MHSVEFPIMQGSNFLNVLISRSIGRVLNLFVTVILFDQER